MSNIESRAAAFDRSPIPALVYGPDGMPRDANRAYRDFAGLGARDALGLAVWDRLHPEDRESVLDGWRRFQRDEELTEPLEVRVGDAHGRWHWMLLVAASLPGRSELILTLIDVTARREADERREQGARYVQALLDQSADIITVLEADGTWRSSSPQGSAMLGYPRGYDPPGGIFSIVHPDDRDAAAAALASVVDGTTDRTVPVEIRLATAAGGYRRFDVVGVSRIDDPIVRGIVVSARDVTERHDAQAALAASEERYADLVNHMSEGLWCIDGHGITTFVNPRMAEMLGTSEDAMLGTPMFDWIARECRAEAGSRLAGRRTGVAEVHEMTLLRADGSRLAGLVAAAPTMHDGLMVEAVGVITDISDLKATEAKLDAARRAALAASEAKTMFLSHVSHELRTPLHGIVGFAALLSGHDDEQVARFAGHIEQSGLHLSRLIQDLLDVTRLESGGVEVHPEPVVLAEVVADAVALAAMDPARVVAATGDAVVLADRVRLTQVLVNLLANAQRHGPADGTITVRAEEGGGRVRILVCDEGPGLTPAEAARIFDPFVQLRATAGDGTGTGLGLTICQGFVDAMGGTIAVLPGAPTRFAVELAAATHPGSGAAGGDGRRLVVAVEDDPAGAELLAAIFEGRDDLALAVAGTVADGLALVAARRPDVVVLDVHLPDGTGLDALAAIRSDEATAGTPVVVVTAVTAPGLRAAALATGADAYLTKPYRVPELLGIVDSLASGVARQPGDEVSAVRLAGTSAGSANRAGADRPSVR